MAYYFYLANEELKHPEAVYAVSSIVKLENFEDEGGHFTKLTMVDKTVFIIHGGLNRTATALSSGGSIFVWFEEYKPTLPDPEFELF